ncbi:MAG: ribonuclease [Actinomycetia bacterium]|nr:ribonuclease [Actinomycetes bacterium]
MAHQPMCFDEFHAALALLPHSLHDQALRLRSCAVHYQTCPLCLTARKALQLAFSTAAYGEEAWAQALLGEAEHYLHDGQHPPGCSRHIRTRQPTVGGLLRTAIRGQAPCRSAGAPLIAATDASWKQGQGGLGYVVSDGRWGMRGWQAGHQDPTGRSKVLVNELRAVALLLSAVDGATEFTLLVDSLPALRFLRRWQRGDLSLMPEGYDLRPRRSGAPTLVRVAEQVAVMPGLRMEHVKGHSGHLLNEAADALASMSRRRLSQPFDARGRAEDLVRSFLIAWHQPDALTA